MSKQEEYTDALLSAATGAARVFCRVTGVAPAAFDPPAGGAAAPARPCKNCESADYARPGDCWGCRGARVFAAPDWRAILAPCVSSRLRWRTAPPDRRDARAYYLWRMVRFHGGADVTLPWTAECLTRSDPWQPELDTFAHAVAAAVFPGSRGLSGTSRWGSLLVGGRSIARDLDLDAAAIECGPVVTVPETGADD